MKDAKVTGNLIPKTFHFTYPDDSIPDHLRRNINRVRSIYPGHRIVIHCDDDIVEFSLGYFPFYHAKVFEKMPEFIMKVDTVRYMWMYKCGGVYSDLDIRFVRRVDFERGVVLFEREWTYPEDSSIGVSIHNCIFASEPNHPFWMDILSGIEENVSSINNKRLLGRWFRKGGREVFDITGPNAISRIVSEKKLLQKYDDVRVMPGSFLYQDGFSKGRKESAYVVHEAAGSWRE